jgi:hypothetical protein
MGLILTEPQLRKLTLDDLRGLCDDLSIEFAELDTKADLTRRIQAMQQRSNAAATVAIDHLREWSLERYRATGDERYSDAYQSIASLTRDGLL